MSWTPPSPDEIRSLRKKLRLTQRQMADLMEVLPRNYQRYEASDKTLLHTSPSYHTWELLMLRLGISEVPLEHLSLRRFMRRISK